VAFGNPPVKLGVNTLPGPNALSLRNPSRGNHCPARLDHDGKALFNQDDHHVPDEEIGVLLHHSDDGIFTVGDAAEAFARYTLETAYLHGDDTPVPELEPGAAPPRRRGS
jgi:hypothetical protein